METWHTQPLIGWMRGDRTKIKCPNECKTKAGYNVYLNKYYKSGHRLYCGSCCEVFMTVEK